MMLSYMRTFGLLGLLIVLIGSIGCSSGRYPVTGIVKYADGTPVDGGTIIAEGEVDGKLVALQANIEPDGKFTLGSSTPGEGAFPGDYRVMIMPVALGDAEMAAGKKPSVSGKYGKFESSGLTLKVVEGENKPEFVVSR